MGKVLISGQVMDGDEVERAFEELGEPVFRKRRNKDSSAPEDEEDHRRFLNKDGSLNHELIWCAYRAKSKAESEKARGKK